MNSGAASSSKKRGQYVSRACNECRRRRCKCDGGQPACGTCVFYGRECSWSTENDARRPATKQLVESLHVKIQMLEAELAQLKSQHGIPLTDSGSVPPSPLDNKSVLPVEPPELSNIERPTPAPGQTTTVMYRYIFEIDSSVPTNEQPKDAHLSLVCHWNRYLPSVPQLTRFEHDTLLLRFFKYGVCWLHCMIPETFLHDMLYSLTSEPSASGNQVRLQHYTPILHCSILAFATAFSENPDVRSLPVRAQFAHHAKQWLDSEFERPTMSLVRALALLAEYHAGIGEREAGFMYMGMSSCAARSLIVNMDKEQWHSDAAAPFPESISCDWHYWSSFAQDKIMALEYRQEYDMPIPHQGVSLPSIDVESDSQPWSDGAAGFPPRLTTKVFFESCKLMVISTKIIDYLHNRDHDAASERAVINIHLQLDTWFNNLPRELLVWARSTSPLPHMIVLHVCYWYLIICLHQPFYGRAVGADGSEGSTGTMADGTPAAEVSTESGTGPTPIHDLSIKMSDRATHKIVQLLQMFEQQHGMVFFPRNMIHVIQQCGLALLREAACVPATATKKRSNALEGVSACMRALRGTARSWPWAGRLAADLEGKLSDAGVNVTTSPFVSTMTVPTMTENDPSTMDISQTLYQFIHVWEPMAAEGSVGAEPMANIPGMALQASSSGLGMQAGPSGLGLQTGQPRMGSQGPASGTSSHHPRPADHGARGGLAAMGGNQPKLETHSYNMLPFSGTPSSSSTSSYSANEGMWGPSLFE